MLKKTLLLAFTSSSIACVSADGAPIGMRDDFGKFSFQKGRVVIQGDDITVNGKTGYITRDQIFFNKDLMQILNLQKRTELDFNQYLVDKSQTYAPVVLNSFVLTQTGWKFNQKTNLNNFSAEQLTELYDLQRYLTNLYKKQNEQWRRCIASKCLNPNVSARTAQEEEYEKQRRAKIEQDAEARKAKIKNSKIIPAAVQAEFIEQIEQEAYVETELGR